MQVKKFTFWGGLQPFLDGIAQFQVTQERVIGNVELNRPYWVQEPVRFDAEKNVEYPPGMQLYAELKGDGFGLTGSTKENSRAVVTFSELRQVTQDEVEETPRLYGFANWQAVGTLFDQWKNLNKFALKVTVVASGKNITTDKNLKLDFGKGRKLTAKSYKEMETSMYVLHEKLNSFEALVAKQNKMIEKLLAEKK